MVQRVGMPLRQSFTQDMAHPDERASVAALSNLPAQGTMAAGQAAGGWLFDAVNLSTPFTLAALFQVGNAALYWLLFAHRPPHHQTPPGAADPPAPAQARTATG
jgi:predicted MFS family arabinose efflux permease